jgi:hypothetical protein
MRRLVLAAIVALGLGAGLAGAAPAGAAPAGPPMVERKVEVLKHRPSGFWTSNRPAVGGAYRWRMLGIGVVLAGVTGFLMLRVIRRANAERLQRDKAK